MTDNIFNTFSSTTQAKAKKIVNRIEELWYNKLLSDEHGFREDKPKMQTKKEFKIITVFLKSGEKEAYSLSLEEYKAYKTYKYKMLGMF